MNTEHSRRDTLKFGIYASISLTILTVITFVFAMAAIPSSGPYCPDKCMSYPFPDILSYYPRDYYWMYLAVFQLFAYIIFVVTNHFIASPEKRMYSFISIAFALISTTVLLIAYFTQFTVIPISVMKGETDGIALLTQYNGHGIFIALEELGYITMSISFLFLAPVFSFNSRIEKSIRIILIVQFVLNLFSFISYAIKFGIDRSYRFEVSTITINWILIIVITILTSLHLKKLLNRTELRN